MDTQLRGGTDQFNTRDECGKGGKGERSLRNLIFGSTAHEKSDDGGKAWIISENSFWAQTERFAHVGSVVISRSTIAKVDSSILKRKLRYLRVRVLTALEHFVREITFTENIGIFTRNISPEDINHLLLVLTKEGKISVIGFTTMKARTKESNEYNDRNKNKRHL